MDEIFTDEFLNEFKSRIRGKIKSIDFEALREEDRNKIEATKAEKRQAERNKAILGAFEGWYK